MHPNPIFRQTGADENLAFASERGFGMLVIDGPHLAHVPFVISDTGDFAELHLVRSNPIARLVKGATPAKIAVSGPDSYVSPDWYGLEDQVPTWNYVAVHLTGTLSPMPDDALRGVLDRLSATFEERLLPKTPWMAEKMPEEVLARMMRMIQPFRFDITSVDGTWKLGQNKPDAAREGAAAAMDGFGIGQETRVLAALMRGVAGKDM
ncbi:FMN-binding negative transcriptional regulator [Shimia biformata]|uniref:FMN-binding negative transcriptional regulator n=1 Tax=Shimia biformata TaxID=1294299 RepID=UPI001952368D|nr:FMN-binding negative transcriptional regulator [Shimia biformata]